MSAGGAHDSRRRVPFGIFSVGVIESGETAASAHLRIMRVSLYWAPKKIKTNFFLTGKPTEIIAVRIPGNEVCVTRSKFWILLIAGDLSSLESETCVNAEDLIVEMSE